MEVEPFFFKIVELLSMSTEHPSMTQQPQEMVMTFTTGLTALEPSPSTIRALLPTPPILPSKVSLNEGCVVCRTIPNPTNHFTLPLHQFLPLSSHRIRFGHFRHHQRKPERNRLMTKSRYGIEQGTSSERNFVQEILMIVSWKSM